jgi:acetyltransferase-like isoleucine patch superfamily enzyme
MTDHEGAMEILEKDYFAVVGQNCSIHNNVILGLKYKPDCRPVRMGDHCVIRALSIIYADVTLGDHCKTGHHVTIREHTRIGSYIVIGTGVVIDGHVEIGSYVKIESGVYIPTHTRIGNHVFIGPCAVLTNDKYPLRQRDRYEPAGPILEDNVTIGANATILPGIRISEGSMIAAGSIVTSDVPSWSLAIGVPARVQPLPDHLREPNRAKRW